MINLSNYPTNYFGHTYQQIVTSFYNHAKDAGANGRSPLFVLDGTEKMIKEELVR